MYRKLHLLTFLAMAGCFSKNEGLFIKTKTKMKDGDTVVISTINTTDKKAAEQCNKKELTVSTSSKLQKSASSTLAPALVTVLNTSSLHNEALTKHDKEVISPLSDSKNLEQKSTSFDLASTLVTVSSSLSLHKAVVNNDKSKVIKLLSDNKNLELINNKNTDGDTPLLIAAKDGDLEIMKILLDKGADAFIEGSDGLNSLDYLFDNKRLSNSLLMYAIKKKSVGDEWINIIEELLDKNADPNMMDSDHSTPLMYAAGYGHLNIVEMLINKGAKIVNKEHMSIKDDTNSTVLMYAAEGGNIQVVRCLIKKLKKILTKDEFISYINEKDRDGDTALLIAVKTSKSKEKKELMTLLLENGADASIKDKHNRTAMSIAEVTITPSLVPIKEEAWAKAFTTDQKDKSALNKAS